MNFTHQILTLRKVMLALFLIVLGAGAALAQNDQVPFTAEGTAVITSVTKLPGGLTQLDGTTKGKVTHLGDVSGPFTRIQDNQGNFNSALVFIGANEKDSIFVSTSGQFDPKGSGGNKCLVVSTGTYTVTGGTGAFANATVSGK